MASLTEVSYATRKYINIGILILISYIILRISWSVFLVVMRTVFPPKPPAPKNEFGVLPAVQFPKIASPSGTLTYTLETISGAAPVASASANVYFMPKSSGELLTLTNAQKFAERLQFSSNAIKESNNIYRFTDEQYPLRRMRYDVVSRNFVIRYAYEQEPALFSERNIATVDKAKQEAVNFMRTTNLYVDDIEKGTSSVRYLRLVKDIFIPASSQSQADAVRVDFFRKPVDGMPIVSPYPGEGPVAAIYSGSKNERKRLIQFAYTFWPIDYSKSSTYGLITGAQAWEDLKNGKGFIAKYPTKGTNVVVRNAYLAYYDAFEPQPYLQPVFVFEGDEGFIGYVPAVAPPWRAE